MSEAGAGAGGAGIASAAFGVGGSLLKGASSFQAGKANARMLRAEARSNIVAGVAEEADIRAQARRTAGQAIAAMGANGTGLGTGSAIDLLREVELESGLDQLRVRRSAANRAASLRAQASAAKRQGIFDLIGAGLEAGAAGASMAGSLKGGADKSLHKARMGGYGTKSDLPLSSGLKKIGPSFGGGG